MINIAPSCLLLTLLVSTIIFLNSALAGTLLIDDFNKDLQAWEEEYFKGRNQYDLIAGADGNQVLQARSNNSASALIQRIKIDPVDFPVISWRWKVAATIPLGDAREKTKDDYSARIYIVFPHWLKPLSRTINYIWANKLPVGESIPSPYFQRSVMLAVQSGNENAGKWIAEERNLLDDYRRLFGEEPSHVGGIAIMTDTDNTGGTAQAWYDDIKLISAD